MSDRESGSGVSVWIALRRAHQGGVATLAGSWFDSGRPVPDYVADALEELTCCGLLALGEPDPLSCGVRRITVTDLGYAHYLALRQIHQPHEQVTVHRWTPEIPANTPAGRRSSSRLVHFLAPGGQPDPIPGTASSIEQPRRCPAMTGTGGGAGSG